MLSINDLYINWPYIGKLLLVGGIGALSGFIELVSRYANMEKLKSIKAGWFYVTLNAVIACLVYVIMEISDFKVGFGNYKSGDIARLILAGTSSMIILRSSIANVKLGNQEFGIGLAPLLQVLLNWVNRNYDRANSVMDLEEISKIMEDVKFDVLERNIHSLCAAMMKSLSVEEMAAIGKRVSEIGQDSTIDVEIKKINIGLFLAPYMGVQLLSSSIEKLKSIKPSEVVIDSLLEAYNDSEDQQP